MRRAMKKARFTVRCLVENLYKVTYKFRISGIVTTLFISRKVLQTRPQFCFAAILLFCIFAENKRFSYAKTGIDYGSHFGHRTRHGAPAGKGGIRRHRHGPPGRPARDAARGDRSGGRPLHDARLRRALRGGGAPQPLSARKHRPAGQQRGSRRRTGAHRPGRHARLGRHDRHQRQGASLRHAARSPGPRPTRTARSTAPRNTPCTPFRSRCAPTYFRPGSR